MLREKKGRPFSLDIPPNSKMPASSRKKSRCSGKNTAKRVRLSWRVSTGVSEKSVLKVRAPVSAGVKR
jgi:hypothetical protein